VNAGSCFTSCTYRVTLLTNPMISHEWGKNRIMITTKENICCHLWHRYSVTVNKVLAQLRMDRTLCCPPLFFFFFFWTSIFFSYKQHFATFYVSLYDISCQKPGMDRNYCLIVFIVSSRYVFSCVICFRFIHFILISTAHALFLTCLPVSIYGT
jgi:hypothetical protein